MQGVGENLRPVAPSYSYALISMSNVVATTCQYEALKFVTFPLQTLGKCAKMIPVMLWGNLMMRKRCAQADDFLLSFFPRPPTCTEAVIAAAECLPARESSTS